ncbi:enoyl-CoA hydratase/isomerase family protein [Pedobacter yulinensis]|uniref:Enoyl-CoA hydratase/isomerase family protein n=1 Tax=Pedobacter yulinensis TaxID=2126353 RepID=A0A2T3HQI7_9SPHI|nr:enoyl-CoA hydratase/isomerase family protein [Pedobacter yulinensis]PST84735.1 enoyl-CoA hydratase/isomerase family protein [Pedobacter yulinensis]
MNTILVNVRDRLATITLNRPKSNALNREMIGELNDMFVNIAADDQIAGLVVTGKEPFFSAGLDLVELYGYNEAETESFWRQFLEFVQTMVSFPKPFVAAVSGHSPAGGCIIALAADYRVMAEGKYIIGLNEVPVGIIVPESIFELYAFWLGKAAAARSLLEGRLFQPAEALAAGLVDEVVNPAGLLTAAERKITKYMQLERNTWQQSKLNIRRSLIAASGANQDEMLDKMLQQWWSPATRHILETILKNLQKT